MLNLTENENFQRPVYTINHNGIEEHVLIDLCYQYGARVTNEHGSSYRAHIRNKTELWFWKNENEAVLLKKFANNESARKGRLLVFKHELYKSYEIGLESPLVFDDISDAKMMLEDVFSINSVAI